MEPPRLTDAKPGGRETQLSLTLKHWCLWQSEESAILGGWPGGEILPCNAGQADVGFLPMMQRRRLSPMGRAACAVAWRCRSVGGDMPSVFCSIHGESQYYFEMLEGMAVGEEVSPSRFSLCVHNAIAGLSSFHSESFSPYVALAGGTEGIYAAFLEAAGLLLDYPKVLVVCYGQPLPAAYQAYLASPKTTWALGVVLARQDEPGLKLRLSRTSASGPALQEEAEPSLVRAIQEGRRDSFGQPGRSNWQWSLDDA